MEKLKNTSKLEILYEDNDIFVINKPAMLYSVMLKEDENQSSLAKILLQDNPWLALVSNKKEDAGLLQRLDFETSGCILGAKNAKVWQILFNKLKAGEIHKTYLAMVEGSFKEKVHLETFLGSKGRHSQKVQIIRNPRQARTLPASSDFFPYSYNEKENISLVLAKVPTARRHQIRAHLSYLGYPLLGDTLYGSRKSFSFDQNRKFFLHAMLLEFPHPITKNELKIESTIQDYLRNWFE